MVNEQALQLQLAQALKGDENAFAGLVELAQTPVYNLCYRMLGDELAAEDAAQETFWRAYQGLKKYDPARPFITWLLSIAAHYCIDQHRRKRLPSLDLDLLPEEDAPDPAPVPENVVVRREEQVRVQRLLENLNPQDKAAIVLRYWHEMSEEEIAQTLNLSVSAVKSRLFRARKFLANVWDAQQPQAVCDRRKHELPART